MKSFAPLREIQTKVMSRIQELFKKKSNNILNVYCTAGYPKLESTLEVLTALYEAGADLVELGMPYSDPLADGPVIQDSSTISLQNGMTIAKLFEQLRDWKALNDPTKTDSIPIVLMGYMNPVLQYGFENFCADAAANGVDGLILPDLPQYEFENEYGAIIKKYGLDFIFLVTPETSEERVKQLDNLSSGFLYAVSSSSTTGKDKDFGAVEQYLQRLQHLQLKNPILVGFGIKDKETFASACKYAAGAIIGSAFVKALEGATNIGKVTKGFVMNVKGE